jgi:hypothetical protein
MKVHVVFLSQQTTCLLENTEKIILSFFLVYIKIYKMNISKVKTTAFKIEKLHVPS